MVMIGEVSGSFLLFERCQGCGIHCMMSVAGPWKSRRCAR
jgi:hypothetical protein